MVMDDTPSFPAMFLGALRIGAVPVPTNFLARSDDFAYFLDDSYATVAVVDAAFLPKVGPVVAGRRGVRLIVADRDGPATGLEEGSTASEGGGEDALPARSQVHSLEQWFRAGETETDPLATHAEDMAFWLYSSGSTGRPKGVIHSHADLLFTCESYARHILETTWSDVHFSTTKLFHAYGLGNNLTFPLWSGATAVYLRGKPTPGRALERIRAERPTLLFSVPTLYNLMMSAPGFQETDFSPVRRAVSAAEPLPPEVARTFEDATGVEILDGIGSTEMLHIYCSNRAGNVRPGTTGTPVPGYDLQIRAENGSLLGPGESGELMVRGGSMLSGYWHQRSKTRASLQGEWFASGDRYRMDDQGAFRYEGRMDDMMKVGGLWVSPIEIENRLLEHGAVHEAAVVGIEVDGLTRIKAFVIRRGPERVDLADELRTWCKAALQRHQYPHFVEFVDDFPRTVTGKIQRFRLRSERPGTG